MADPAYGNKTMQVAQFMAVWKDKIAFVVSRKDGTRPKGKLAIDPAEVSLVTPEMIRLVMP
jgi:predicted double-glycine peptidase